MTDVLHSQVLVGSRHAIHNLTYPNAANRIAGTNEGKGIVPLTVNNLWQIAKQDDDNSIWMCVDTAPLTWEQIATSTTGDLDFGYDAFGANPSTIVVDAAEGQTGSLLWDLSGTGSDNRFFDIDFANGTDETGGDGVTYHTGFRVLNGLDSFRIVRSAADIIDLLGTLSEVAVQASTKIELSSISTTLELLANLPSGDFLCINTNSTALTGSSGVQSFVEIAPSITQTGTAGYNGLLINVDINSVGSGEKNLLNLQLGGADRFRVDSTGAIIGQSSTADGSTNLIDLQDSGPVTQFVVNSDGNVRIGTGTPGVATGAGDLFVSNRLEVNSVIQAFSLEIENAATISGLDPAGLGAIRFRNVAQTPDTMTLEVGSLTNSIVMIQYGDAAFDFAHGAATNPTLIGHSANQSTTEWWSLTHDQTYARLLTGAGAFCIGSGTPAVATGAGDGYVTGNLEVNNNIHQSNDTSFGGLFLSSGGSIRWRSTDQTPDTTLFQTGSLSNSFVICEYADRAFDFAHALQTNPTIFGHSANQSTTEWWSLTHDQTNAVWASGAGGLALAPASGEVILPDAGRVVYDIAPASDLTATGDISSSTVDSNATGIGATLYQAADGNWDETDADALATMPCRALALEAGTGTKKILRRGWIRNDAWAWTPGGPVYVSTTTGALTQTKPSGTGDQVQIVGYAETADILDFNPSSVIVEVA